MSQLFRFFALLMLILGMGTILVFLTVSSQKAHQQDRVIVTRPFAHAPVKIITVKTKAGNAKLGSAFKDEDDWFKALSFRLENTTNKPIIYISAVVIFPKPSDGDLKNPPYGEHITYGESPLQPSTKPKQPVRSILPGENLELSFTNEAYEATTAVLQQLKYPESISRIELSIQEVGFEDGTVWSGGIIWRSDPIRPGKVIRVPEEKNSNDLMKRSFRTDQVAFAQKVTWIKPLDELSNCHLMSPEVQVSCTLDSGCSVRTRDIYEDPSVVSLKFA